MKKMAHAAMFNMICAAKFLCRGITRVIIKATRAVPVYPVTLLQMEDRRMDIRPGIVEVAEQT